MYQWGTGLLSQAKRALNPQPVPAHLSSKEPCLVTGRLYGGLLDYGDFAGNANSLASLPVGLDQISAKSVTAGSMHCACLTGEVVPD